MQNAKIVFFENITAEGSAAINLVWRTLQQHYAPTSLPPGLQGVKNTTSFTLTNAFSSNFHHRSPLVTLSDPENAKELVEKYDYVAGGNTVVEY